MNISKNNTVSSEASPNLKAKWQRPVVSCIDIKRTLADAGSPSDLFQTGQN
jgi:hypothetical protein